MYKEWHEFEVREYVSLSCLSPTVAVYSHVNMLGLAVHRRAARGS